MKRDDITPEELDVLLVAFADDELDEPQFTEILELISANSDLAAKVENFKTTGAILADFFASENLEAPKHIADEIRLMATKQDQVVARATPAAASYTPDISGIKNKKVVSLSAFKKLRAKLSLTPQSLTQMVAACALGLVLSPSLFNTNVELSSGTNKLPMNFRGAEKTVLAPALGLEQAILIMAQSQNGEFENAIKSGGFIQLETPFIINITSPISGAVRVYEEVDGTLSNTLGGVEKNQLFEGNISKGSVIKLPENGAFSLSDQESFILITEFFNEHENQRIRSVYRLK
jgi:hypothetical protein